MVFLNALEHMIVIYVDPHIKVSLLIVLPALEYVIALGNPLLFYFLITS